MEQARQELAQYARELTDDGRSVIRLYAEVMDGLKNDEGFKPHHRIAAGRELLKRGFDYDAAYTQTSVTPKDYPNASEHDAGESDNPEHPTHPDSDEEPVDYVAMAKEIVASLDPADFEEEPPSNHKPDYSMWDIIESQPQPEITEEHARIGAALFREEMRKQRLWEESNMKIPTRRRLQKSLPP